MSLAIKNFFNNVLEFFKKDFIIRVSEFFTRNNSHAGRNRSKSDVVCSQKITQV